MNPQTNIKEIYGQYAQQLYFTALRITGSSFDAEEVMQDTILKYHNFPKKEGIEKLGSWLKSVCIRKALDKLRAIHSGGDKENPPPSSRQLPHNPLPAPV